MARLPRLTVSAFPHHVIQRGNNRQAIFSDRADYEFLLALMEEHAAKAGVAIHSYVLMSNHFHLLATPDNEQGLAHLMQGVGRRYVRYFNQRHARSGTLWEGRYRSTLIQAERYLLPCMVYTDLNPVRAGLVADPAQYPWSSHAHYVGTRHDRLLSPHPLYWKLGNTPFSREAAYAELVRAGVMSADQQALTASALLGWALGDPEFLADLQKRTTRRLSKARAGRPPATASRQQPVPD